MASQSLRQRFVPVISTTKETITSDNPSPKPSSPYHARVRAQKLAMADKGLQYLTISVAIPLALTTISTAIAGGGLIIPLSNDREWTPPVWVFHGISMLASSLMGLSAWLVFAEGGFYQAPELLGLYLAQLLLGLAWGPLMFRLEAIVSGFWVCMALMGTTFLCEQFFGQVNVVAGDLVKPVLAWSAFMAVYNCKTAFGCLSPDYVI